MAIDFPNSPTNGQTHTVGDTIWTYDGTKWNKNAVTIVGPTGPTGPEGNFYVSDTAPTGPVSGDVWFNSAVGQSYVYYDSYWVEYGAHVGSAVDPASSNIIISYQVFS